MRAPLARTSIKMHHADPSSVWRGRRIGDGTAATVPCRPQSDSIFSAYWQSALKGVYARYVCDIHVEGYSARFGVGHERCPQPVHDLCRHVDRHRRPPRSTLRLARATHRTAPAAAGEAAFLLPKFQVQPCNITIVDTLFPLSWRVPYGPVPLTQVCPSRKTSLSFRLWMSGEQHGSRSKRATTSPGPAVRQPSCSVWSGKGRPATAGPAFASSAWMARRPCTWMQTGCVRGSGPSRSG